eukprot:TRINITY_DN5058_c0_g2_i2.p1 TRINITY_DN5058_c0_g2~~TRINITY_DN5058_c0_g2_i2.p1  ORF type:complete len:248 (-),score=32.88 TRINITY_DN5058_c0_g2_i2:564-1307(-)
MDLKRVLQTHFPGVKPTDILKVVKPYFPSAPEGCVECLEEILAVNPKPEFDQCCRLLKTKFPPPTTKQMVPQKHKHTKPQSKQVKGFPQREASRAPSARNPVQEYKPFCPQCGSPSSGRFCAECGSPLEPKTGSVVPPSINTRPVNPPHPDPKDSPVSESRVYGPFRNSFQMCGFVQSLLTKNPESVIRLGEKMESLARFSEIAEKTFSIDAVGPHQYSFHQIIMPLLTVLTQPQVVRSIFFKLFLV